MPPVLTDPMVWATTAAVTWASLETSAWMVKLNIQSHLKFSNCFKVKCGSHYTSSWQSQVLWYRLHCLMETSLILHILLLLIFIMTSGLRWSSSPWIQMGWCSSAEAKRWKWRTLWCYPWWTDMSSSYMNLVQVRDLMIKSWCILCKKIYLFIYFNFFVHVCHGHWKKPVLFQCCWHNIIVLIIFCISFFLVFSFFKNCS